MWQGCVHRPGVVCRWGRERAANLGLGLGPVRGQAGLVQTHAGAAGVGAAGAVGAEVSQDMETNKPTRGT